MSHVIPREDWQWSGQLLGSVPPVLAKSLQRAWRSKHAASRRGGNMWLLDIAGILGKELLPGLSGAAGDMEVCDYARARAGSARQALHAGGLAAAIRGALTIGIKPPEADTDAGNAARLACPLWWRRQVRKTHARGIERGAIAGGMVSARAGIYCSDAALKRRQEQRARNRALLEELTATNEADQSYTLAELAELGMSNPKLRRAELMTRIAGFEACAKQAGHAGEFYTWTCPSRMHARLSKSGAENPKYDGTTPRQAQAYLSRQWSRARAALARRGVNVYGVRVTEPHHDGCPHWHMLFFVPPAQVATVRAVLEYYALQVDGDEEGAKKHRFTAVAIDWERGSAAGYVAKYIAKAIDGFGVECDLYGKDAKSSAARIEAWASTWGIRQFQQIGGPSVTVWRELRRVREAAESPALERARFAADAGDWQAYTLAQGGPIAPRDARPVQLALQWSDKPGRYAEALGNQIFGVRCFDDLLQTRAHSWTVERGKKNAATRHLVGSGRGVADGREAARDGADDADVCIASADFLNAPRASAVPWSPVNNCTVENDDRKIAGNEGAYPRRETGTQLCPGGETAPRGGSPRYRGGTARDAYH